MMSEVSHAQAMAKRNQEISITGWPLHIPDNHEVQHSVSESHGVSLQPVQTTRKN